MPLARKPYLFSTPRKSDGSLHKPGVRGIHAAFNKMRQMTGDSRHAATHVRKLRASRGRKGAKIAILKTAARHYRAER